jgi:hypothetical protein
MTGRNRKKVKVNLKLIGRPLDSISRRLDRVIKTRKDTRAAKSIQAELARLRKKLSSICCDNRWFCDV